MIDIPLPDLTEAYLKLINKRSDFDLKAKLIKANTIEEFNAIKESFETELVFPDFDDLSLEIDIVALANRFAEDFSLFNHTEQILGSGLSRFVEYSDPLVGIKKNPKLMALWLLSKYATRSLLVKKQVKTPNFCSLVPLIMSQYKKYKDVPYSIWSLDRVKMVTSRDLFEAMTFKVPELNTEQILKDRQIALTTKSTGKLKSAETTYGLYFDTNSQLYSFPKLTQIMVCQTWCAHPSNRTNYMVLSGSNWDSIPDSLIIASDLFLENSGDNIKRFYQEMLVGDRIFH